MTEISKITGDLVGPGALPYPVTVTGDSLPNIWATSVWVVNSTGMVIPADQPKGDGVVVLTRDVPGLTLDLRQRAIEDAIAKKVHPQCTIKEEKALKTYCDQYELTTNRGWKSATEHVYSYADRFENHPRTLRSLIQRCDLGLCTVANDAYQQKVDTVGAMSFNQTKYIADNLVPYTRRFVMKTWVSDIDYDNPESPCFDDKTEVLTDTGWKLFRDVEEDELVATLDPVTKEFEYQLPTRFVAHKHKGDMITYNGFSVNFSVTADHMMYIRDTQWENERYELRRASELPYQFNVTSRCTFTGKHGHTFVIGKYTFDMNSFLRFLAIYLCDGNYSVGGHNDTRVRITQKKNLGAYRRILNELHPDIKYSEERDKHSDGCKHLCIRNKTLNRYLRQFGRSADKHVPMFVKQLSSDQIGVFLDAFQLGDSYKSGRTVRYNTTSKRMADDLQELIIKASRGTCGNIWKRNGCEYYEVKETKYVNGMQVMKRGREQSHNSIENIPYNGTVYCVEVPNHIIMVRRNGCAMWCGNCLQTVMVRQLDDEGHCDIYEHYRSLDVFGASIYDIVGQANYLNEHIFKPNDLTPVRMLVQANSAHIYERDWMKAAAISPVIRPLPLGCIVNGF